MQVEIDNESGFCFGVQSAINKAEEELHKGDELYCLGDIVHNGIECSRLQKLGLKTINHDQFKDLCKARVLLRAHGEPPSTYSTCSLSATQISLVHKVIMQQSEIMENLYAGSSLIDTLHILLVHVIRHYK